MKAQEKIDAFLAQEYIYVISEYSKFHCSIIMSCRTEKQAQDYFKTIKKIEGWEYKIEVVPIWLPPTIVVSR